MQRSTTMLLPVGRMCRRLLSSSPPVQSRSVWDWTRSGDVRNLIRDMDREFDRLERNFFRNSPLRILAPRFIPIEGKGMERDSYNVNLDLHGFKPEDIKVQINDGVLKIEAKMDRTAEDGSRIQQSVTREFTLPENIDASSLKSLLHSDGILSIEAALENGNEPKHIPIEASSGTPKSKI